MSSLEETEPAWMDGADTSLAEWAATLVDRLQQGEVVDLDAYAQEHPERADELQQILPAIQMLTLLNPSLGVGRDQRREGEAPCVEPLGALGDFELLREVGRGGMGTVYEAVQRSLDRRVALKVLPFAAALDPRQLQRFQAEAQVVARLHHNHIVPVFATGSERGVPYYAMQFIEGRDLAQLIRSARESGMLATEREDFRTIADLGKQAAEALEFAHGNDVLHRDIKPSNLLVDRDGRLWITDFGLARVRGALELTRTGDRPGTPRYMSPEQALGRRGTIDARSDLYSLGATLYELLAGVPAFNDDDLQALLGRIVREEPRPIRVLNAKVPADLETIVMKAMAKDPSDRYATASEVADDLARFLAGQPIRARRPTPIGRLLKWSRRYQRLVTAAVLAVSVVAAALTAAAWWSNSLLRGYNARLQEEIARADRHSRDAEVHRRTAEARRRLADRLLFLATLRLAQQALELGQIERAQDLLRDAAAISGDSEPRGFAWNYLWRAARREIISLRGHEAGIDRFAVSRDGRTLASADTAGILQLWDTAAEQPRIRLTTETEFALHPRFSPDGRFLCAVLKDVRVGPNPRAVVWEAATGRRLRSIPTLPMRDFATGFELAFLAGGEILGIHTVDPRDKHALCLWRWAAGPSSQGETLRLNSLNNVQFALNGQCVMTQDDDGLVLRDPESGSPRATITGDSSSWGPWAFAFDGRRLAGFVPERGIVVWESASGREVGRVECAERPALIGFSTVGSVLAFTDPRHLVHLADWTLGTRRTIHPDDQDRSRYVHFVFSHDGTKLATSSYGIPGGQYPVTVWEVATGKPLRRFPGRNDQASAPEFTADDRILYVSGGPLIRAWRIQPDEPPSPVPHADEAWSLAYSPGGKVLASGYDDSTDDPTLKLWDAETSRLIAAWRGHPATVSALAFDPQGRTLASSSLSPEENLRLWDPATGRLLATLNGHTQAVRTVAFSPDGSTLASGGSDNSVRLWDVAARRARHVLKGHGDTVRHVAFSVDGRIVASSSNDGTVRLWNPATGRPLRVLKVAQKVAALAFVPTGRILAAADESGHITLWDAATGALIKVIRAEGEDLLCLAVSPDSRLIAAAGLSRTIRLWDLETGQEALTLSGHGHKVGALTFHPGGNALASASHDGIVRVWRADRVP